MQNDEDNVCLYVLVRTDLQSLVGTDYYRRVGKVAAQVSHASNQCVFDLYNIEQLVEQLASWQGDRGYGTCIVLGISSLDDMLELVYRMRLNNIHTGVVTDPTYPLQDGAFVHKISVSTCAYAFGLRSKLAEYLTELPLLP